ncbi:aminotransferase class V-fold PLP-dependent enzyme [Arthrobacter roseus]|uniref:aminotransferase class V-fold PLP-dependent enzyme n=1 Tax=Arthrobacter roseus TaxID=136274 RepID=UPI001962E46C|nr:aminotransferase class V-fold PLP-dependent enzyme [Arthrobacter roseus]MBM7847869.1 selenocysteine lyase/cysteine desulfurase [Arthrobacter roseus]
MSTINFATDAAPDFDPTQFRRDFPPLSNMTHLASCSQGALSTQVSYSLLEIVGSLQTSAAPWDVWVGKVEQARADFARLINADPSEIAIVNSASEGAYQVVSSFAWTSRTGIVTSAVEFPSVGHVLRAQQAQGATIKMVSDRSDALEVPAWEKLIDESTALVSAPLVSYHDGARPPLAEITELAHKAGARMFVDAYQGAGVVPIDVKAMDCDYLVAGSLKYMLGLAGVAFLYVKDGIDSERAAELTGWFGRVNPFAFDPELVDYPTDARRFEVGTPAIPAVYAAIAGMGLLLRVDQAAGFAHVLRLGDRLAAGAAEHGFKVSRSDNSERHGPQVAIFADDPNELGAWLNERGIMTAPRGELLRMSLHYYTTDADIDTAIAALAEYRSVEGGRG